MESAWGVWVPSFAGRDGQGMAHWRKPKGHYGEVAALIAEGARRGKRMLSLLSSQTHGLCER